MKFHTRKPTALAALLLTATFAFAGCGGDDGGDGGSADGGSGGGGGGDLSITMLPKNLGNAYFDTSTDGAQKAADEIGADFEEVGPDTAQPRRAGVLHQHRRPAGQERADPLRQRPGRPVRRGRRGPQC